MHWSGHRRRCATQRTAHADDVAGGSSRDPAPRRPPVPALPSAATTRPVDVDGRERSVDGDGVPRRIHGGGRASRSRQRHRAGEHDTVLRRDPRVVRRRRADLVAGARGARHRLLGCRPRRLEPARWRTGRSGSRHGVRAGGRDRVGGRDVRRQGARRPPPRSRPDRRDGRSIPRGRRRAAGAVDVVRRVRGDRVVVGRVVGVGGVRLDRRVRAGDDRLLRGAAAARARPRRRRGRSFHPWSPCCSRSRSGTCRVPSCWSGWWSRSRASRS